METFLTREGEVNASILRAQALGRAGVFAIFQGAFERAREFSEESRRLCQDLGDTQGYTAAVSNLAQLAHSEGQLSQAETLFTETLDLSRELEFPTGIVTSLSNLGEIVDLRGDHERARALLAEAVSLGRQLKDSMRTAAALSILAMVLRRQGDTNEALTFYRDSLRLFQTGGDRRGIARCLDGIAGLAVKGRLPERGARLLGGATALREGMRVPLEPDDAGERAERVWAEAAVREALTDADFEAAWTEGRAMSLTEAVDFALDETVSGCSEGAERR